MVKCLLLVFVFVINATKTSKQSIIFRADQFVANEKTFIFILDTKDLLVIP